MISPINGILPRSANKADIKTMKKLRCKTKMFFTC